MERPLILLTNDDGYLAPGLGRLRDTLDEFGETIVCAPHQNQSASSHALTLMDPLCLRRHDVSTFSVDGTPADCVYIALHSGQRVLPRRPDLVVSGMNFGPNLGADIMYSGTVAAAREGAYRGIPAIAISAAAGADRRAAAQLGSKAVVALWQHVLRGVEGIPLLNVNIPPGSTWPVCATRLGRRRYDDDVHFRHNPRGREYLWIGGSNVLHDLEDGTDTAAWEAGQASVTPLTLDMNGPAHALLAREVAGLTG